MVAKQITLLDHALDLLSIQEIPYPLDTETTAKVVGVSKTTLNRAKNLGHLPYSRSFEGGTTLVEHDHNSKNKDYWKVSFRKTA